MARRATYGAAILLTLAAVLAMAWAAVRPGAGAFAPVFAWTGTALDSVGGWFRGGPAGGEPDWDAASREVFGGDAARGPALMVAHGCGACHVIPGVTGARGTVGPHLSGFADRAYVAGILPNEPGGLVRWLVDPPAHSPQTAMPNLGVTEAQARDMAAYLYTLRGG